MYRNRERLARALAVCVEQYGPGMLRDGQRTRNLLSDEFGASEPTDRADIDQFVAVLNASHDAVTQPDVPVSSAAAAAAAAAGVTLDDAAWTITTLRSLTARMAGPPPMRPPVGATVLDSDPVAEVAAATTRRWPRSAKIAVVVLACLAIAATVAGGVLFTSARRDRDRARDAGAVAAESGESASSKVDDLNEQVAQAKATVADLQRQLDAAKSSAGTDASTIADLQAKLDTANASLTSTSDSLTAANAALGTAQQQLDVANQRATPFGVGQGAVTVPDSRFTFSGSTTACEGYRPGTECSRYRSFKGYVRQDGTSKSFEIPGIVKIPLTSTDGLLYVGQEGTPGSGISCHDAPVQAVLSVTMQPMSFSADPSTRRIIATSYTATVEMYSPAADGCGDTRQAFAGVLTFEGLS